jgi:hypothetical protein
MAINTGEAIEQALKKHTPGLMGIPGVVGTAQGLSGSKPCILVMVVARSRELVDRIPRKLGGHPVRIQVTGEIRARGKQV